MNLLNLRDNLRNKRFLFGLGGFACAVLLAIYALSSIYFSQVLRRREAEFTAHQISAQRDVEALIREKGQLDRNLERERAEESRVQNSKHSAEQILALPDTRDEVQKSRALQFEIETVQVELERMPASKLNMQNEVEEAYDKLRLGLLASALPILGFFLLGYLRPSDEGAKSVPATSAHASFSSDSPVVPTSDEEEDDEEKDREKYMAAISATADEQQPRVVHEAEPKIGLAPIKAISVEKQSEYSLIGTLFISNHARLRNEVQDLGKRGNLNLVVGVLITTVATAVLVYLVTRPHPTFGGLPGVLEFYIPRVTTIVLIETFAYFFLGLYKSNLEEIKYYQNELTGLFAMEVAWRASLADNVGSSTALVIQQIVKTDRNSLPIVPKASSESDILEILKSLTKMAADAGKGAKPQAE